MKVRSHVYKERWIGPAGRDPINIWGWGRRDKGTYVSSLTSSRSGRNATGEGGATLIFCQGRGAGFVGGARPLAWKVATCLDPGSRGDIFPSLKKRKYQTPSLPDSPVLPVRFSMPGSPLGGGSSPIPAVVFVEGAPYRECPWLPILGPYWMTYLVEARPYDATRKCP